MLESAHARTLLALSRLNFRDFYRLFYEFAGLFNVNYCFYGLLSRIVLSHVVLVYLSVL